MAHPTRLLPMLPIPLTEPRQLRIAFEHVDLRSMTAPERANAVTRLALLLLEAAGVQMEEAHDEQR